MTTNQETEGENVGLFMEMLTDQREALAYAAGAELMVTLESCGSLRRLSQRQKLGLIVHNILATDEPDIVE